MQEYKKTNKDQCITAKSAREMIAIFNSQQSNQEKVLHSFKISNFNQIVNDKAGTAAQILSHGKLQH